PRGTPKAPARPVHSHSSLAPAILTLPLRTPLADAALAGLRRALSPASERTTRGPFRTTCITMPHPLKALGALTLSLALSAALVGCDLVGSDPDALSDGPLL